MANESNLTRGWGKKFFTVREVERLLPAIEQHLRRAIKLDKALDLLATIELEVYNDDLEYLPKITKINKQFHKLSYQFYRSLEVIEDSGAIIRDLDLGVVDFITHHEGKELFLCWKIGDKGVKFWHTPDTDFLERKPLTYLQKKHSRKG